MAATITVETGAGLTNSNSYVTLAEANTFFDTHPEATAWAALTDDVKNRHLINSARVIDYSFDFNGFKSNAEQAMQWPRVNAPDQNQGGGWYRIAGSSLPSGYFPSDAVPQEIKNAQCEQARMNIAGSRINDAPGQGIKAFELPGAIKVEFDNGSLVQIVTDYVINMLKPFGSFRSSRSGSVKLGRA